MVFLEVTATVGHKIWFEDGTDPLGNPIEGWAEPVPLGVYGYGPAASLADTEPAARDTAVITAWQLFCPPDTIVGPHDRFIVEGVEWEQVGEGGDFTHGPFGWAPGIVVQIRRAVG